MARQLTQRLARLESTKTAEHERPWHTFVTYSDRPGVYFTSKGEKLAEKDAKALRSTHNVIVRRIIVGKA